MSRKRQYGSVEKRGVAQWRLNQIRSWRKPEKEKKIEWYFVPSGTLCQIRKSGLEWSDYQTKKDIRCCGFVWRNETHIGLLYGDYEIKLKRRDIIEGAAHAG